MSDYSSYITRPSSLPAELPSGHVPSPGAWTRALADFVTLTKPRVNLLVVMTTGNWVLSRGGGWPDPWRVFPRPDGDRASWRLGAAAFNQIYERDIDRLMRRTHDPARCRSGHLERWETRAGLRRHWRWPDSSELGLGTTWLAAAVAAATIVSYALVYTPLKTRTSLATVVGAVPGALPPLIGWAAAERHLSHASLVALCHRLFLADAARAGGLMDVPRRLRAGGIRMLPVVEPDGGRTARQIVSYAAALIPVSLLPTATGLAGRCLPRGGRRLTRASRVERRLRARAKTRTCARLFYASLVYLPHAIGGIIANRT